MPVFDSMNGGHVYIPAGRILYAESGDGGLTAKVVTPSIQANKGLDVAEVRHTVADVGEKIIAELERVRP